MSTNTDPGGADDVESVDWDGVDGGARISWRTRLFGVAAALLAAAFLAYRVNAFDDTPLESLEVSLLDWLFLLSLLAFLFYVIAPLAIRRRMTAEYWQRFRRNKLAVVSLAYLGVFLVAGTVGPLVVSEPALHVRYAFQPPVGLSVDSAVVVNCLGELANGRCHGSFRFPFGTTRGGKNVVTLVLYGASVSLKVALIASMLIVPIAIGVGTTAAHFGGRIDEVLMRYVDIQEAVPALFVYVLLMTLYGRSLLLLIAVFGLMSWGGVARMVRSEAIQQREEAFVTASRSAGASRLEVIRYHLLPNVSTTVLTATTRTVPALIITEAALAFLDLDAETITSWGTVIKFGLGQIRSTWWVAFFPVVFLSMTVLAFYVLGDALRDTLDPRMDR